MPEYRDIYSADRKPTGRCVLRGEKIKPGEFLMGVGVWLRNSKGEFLISKRSVEKIFPLKWECTGGGVQAGESTLAAAVREVGEELGIHLRAEDGRLFASITRFEPLFAADSFEDVYLFDGDWRIEDVRLQDGETCDAKWAAPDEIRALLDAGEFVPEKYFPYLKTLFLLP